MAPDTIPGTNSEPPANKPTNQGETVTNDASQMTDPWRSHPGRPTLDEHSAAVLEEALHSLTMLRAPTREGDAGARLHALASLIAQAEAVLGDAAAEARDQDYSWAQIGAPLGISAATAKRLLGAAIWDNAPTN